MASCGGGGQAAAQRPHSTCSTRVLWGKGTLPVSAEHGPGSGPSAAGPSLGGGRPRGRAGHRFCHCPQGEVRGPGGTMTAPDGAPGPGIQADTFLSARRAAGSREERGPSISLCPGGKLVASVLRAPVE